MARTCYPRTTALLRGREGWKTGTSRAGTSTGSPVLGLRPVRALRCRTLKVPKPRSSIPSPRASASFAASRKASTTSPQSPLGDAPSDRVGDLLHEVGFGHPLLLA